MDFLSIKRSQIFQQFTDVRFDCERSAPLTRAQPSGRAVPAGDGRNTDERVKSKPLVYILRGDGLTGA